MKQLRIKQFLLAASVCGLCTTAFAQDGKGKVAQKEIKEKQQIVITRSGDKDEKTVIEIDGDKVKVNGKEVTDLKDVDVHVSNLKIPSVRWRTTNGQQGSGFIWNDDMQSSIYSVDSNRAMLGVNTESAEKGVRISGITKGSAAEKAGLKKGDIITKIDSRNTQETGDITDAIRAHKPGDKVTVLYLRDNKEQKATAELGRWQGINIANMAVSDNWNASTFNARLQPTEQLRNYNRGVQGFATFGVRPKLGLSVQDTDDGKGVKVLNADEDGNAAKAGVKENDIILQIDDKAINSADELAAQMKEKKDQPLVKFQVQRDGKTQTIDVRIPKKLKTVDL